MEYKVILGDVGGDGHNLTSTLTVSIPDDVANQDLLFDNYEKNHAIAGVGYEDIAEEYEDTTVNEHIGNLTKIGLRFIAFDGGESPNVLPDNIIPVEADGFADGEELFAESDFGIVNLGSEPGTYHLHSYLKIVMYMIGNGIPGWEWRVVPETVPSLLGWRRDGKGLPNGGYGLLTN